MTLLDGKSVVVTDASARIGRAIAIGAGEHGADVAINFNADTESTQSCVTVIKVHGRRELAVQGDVASAATASHFVVPASAAFGKVDVLVSNADICPFQSFLDMPPETRERTMHFNLHGDYYMCQAAPWAVVERAHGGTIVAVSSISAGRRRVSDSLHADRGQAQLADAVRGDRARPLRHPMQLAAAGHHPHRHQQGRSRRSGQTSLDAGAPAARAVVASPTTWSGPRYSLPPAWRAISPARRCWSMAVCS